MKIYKTALFSGAVLAAFGMDAADVSIEGRWLVDGVPQISVDTICSLNFYGEQSAGDALWTTNGCRLATDNAGCFVIGACAPESVSLPDTFWVGVTPAGKSEMSPRFRVAPAPFAFAAGTAELVKSDAALGVTGVARIERLEVAGDAVVEDWVIPAGGSMEVKNMQLPDVRLTSLEIVKGGLLGLFNDGGRIPSCDYDGFTPQNGCEWYVEAKITERGFARHDWSETQNKTASCRFGHDGFLVIAIKADPLWCPSPTLSLKVGDLQVFSEKKFGTTTEPAVKRFMTIPYRAGEEVTLFLSAKGRGEVPWLGQEYSKGGIGVKLRLVRLGRD